MWRRFIVPAGLLIIDRSIKQFALHGFTAEWPGFQFRLFRNSDLVFSLPSGSTMALVVVCIGVAILIWIANRTYRHQFQLIQPVLFILAGAISNLYDRLLHGFVIDWAYLGPWWPVFNLADVMIMVGLVWYIWRREQLTTKK